MKRPPRALATVLALLALPPLAGLVEAVAFHLENRNDRWLMSSGDRREYLLHVPRSYDPARPTPLVISMHGAGGWPSQQRAISGWDEVAEDHGFIVAYPSAVGGRGTRAWRMSGERGLQRDVQFISDLIDAVADAYSIDPNRVYANGLSAGGGMAFALSCRLAERIAAIGTVAGAQVLPWSRCADAPPVPVMALHGTDDALVPYGGGATFVGDLAFPDVERWMADWSRRNRCAPEARERPVAADVTRRDYPGCADGASVVLFTVHGGGHTWPGGRHQPEWFLGATSSSVDASREMWAFFEAHP